MRDILSLADKTKRELLIAFWDLYKYKDIPEITVMQVAKNAGYHRATFYTYFSSLQEALEGLVEEMFKYQKLRIPEVMDFFLGDFDRQMAEMVYLYLGSSTEITYYMTTQDYKQKFLLKFLENENREIREYCRARRIPTPPEFALGYMVYGSRTAVMMNEYYGHPESRENVIRLVHALNSRGPGAMFREP